MCRIANMAGCFCFANPSDFLFGPSQKGTICNSVYGHNITTICNYVLHDYSDIYHIHVKHIQWLRLNVSNINLDFFD